LDHPFERVSFQNAVATFSVVANLTGWAEQQEKLHEHPRSHREN
jgi:hypothetical protein